MLHAPVAARTVRQCKWTDHLAQCGALELLSELPENVERDRREIELQLAVGAALIAVKAGLPWKRDEPTLAHGALWPGRGFSGTFPSLLGIYAMYLMGGDLLSAHALADELMRRAADTEDPAFMLYARVTQGVASYFRGNFTSALEHLEMAISIYDVGRH